MNRSFSPRNLLMPQHSKRKMKLQQLQLQQQQQSVGGVVNKMNNIDIAPPSPSSSSRRRGLGGRTFKLGSSARFQYTHYNQQNSSFNAPPSSKQNSADSASIVARRCTSAPNFQCMAQAQPQQRTNQRNAAVSIALRSSSKIVKSTIVTIATTCQEQQQNPGRSVPSPENECGMLAQLASDAYYKVVISKHKGIHALVSAMKTFPLDPHLQTHCCNALSALSTPVGHNQAAIQETGAVLAIITAMKNIPQSIHVQSAACDALRNMIVMPLEAEKQLTFNDSCHKLELVGLLERVKTMYVTPGSKQNAHHLLTLLGESESTIAVDTY